jgi:hypothetical protein
VSERDSLAQQMSQMKRETLENMEKSRRLEGEILRYLYFLHCFVNYYIFARLQREVDGGAKRVKEKELESEKHRKRIETLEKQTTEQQDDIQKKDIGFLSFFLFFFFI